MAKKKLAIIGNGMAGARLLEDLLARDAQRRFTIDVFGEEPGRAYNRILLSKVLGGEDPDSIHIERDHSIHIGDVTFHRGVRIDRIDTAARHLVCSDKQERPFDIAVIATGSKPFVPKIAGTTTEGGALKQGVFAYRTLDDVLQMRSKARAGDNAVVLGGGLLGLEAAKVLSDTGLHVTVIHLAPQLMETQLDQQAGAMLQRQIERTGIFVRCGRTISSIGGDERVTAITLDDGSVLPADLVVFACGIRPRLEVAQASNIPVNRGVLVNDTLATQVPGVYAVGECAEHNGRVYGIVTPIWDQTRVLADVLSGANPTARYRGSKLYARLKVAGVEVAAMGMVNPELPTDEVVQIVEDRKSSYRKLIVRGNRLIGAQFVGDTEGAAAAVQAFDRDEPLPENRLEIFCPGAGAASDPGERQVCNCHRVSEGTICRAIEEGAETVEQVGACTNAGTGCGSCKGQIARLIALRMPATAR